MPSLLTDFPPYLLIGFFFAFFSAFRFAFNIGLLERPLVLAFVWGLAFGDWDVSLGVGIFFELLWLDHFPAGTFIPANPVIPALVSLSLARYFGLSGAKNMLIPIFLSIPLGHVGARLELAQRKWQDASFNALVRWARTSHKSDGKRFDVPERLAAGSLSQIVIMNFLLYAIGLLVLILFLMHVLPPHADFLPESHLSWGVLWFCAAIGGLLSLRRRKAYVVYAVCVLLTAAAVIFL